MNSTPDSSDRRRFTRVHFDAESYIRVGQREWMVELLDLSLKGALVRMLEPEQLPDATVILEIELLGEEMKIQMECGIAHQASAQVGLRCTHMDLDSASHLRRLVELNLGDSSLLDREIAGLCAGSDED